jgi:hypothetical protein
MLQSADEGKTGIEATINAATKGMLDMALLNSEVVRCFPPSFKVLKIYREQFEEYMLPQVAALYSQNIQNLELGDLLRMVSWLHNYNVQIGDMNVGRAPDDFEEAIDNLMAEYLERAGKQTRDWFANIEKRASEVLPGSDGCLVTRDPEDMLNIVNMQVSVAKEQLPAKLRYKAIKSCIDELSMAQKRLREDVELVWRDTQVENICAVVNDSYRMQDKVENLLDVVDRDEGGEEVRIQLLPTHPQPTNNSNSFVGIGATRGHGRALHELRGHGCRRYEFRRNERYGGSEGTYLTPGLHAPVGRGVGAVRPDYNEDTEGLVQRFENVAARVFLR